MKAVINDVSFEYKFSSKEAAISAFHQWLEICKELGQKKVRRVQELYGNTVDTSLEIAPDYKIIQLIQEFRDREDRSRLLGILLNSRKYMIEGKEEVCIDNKTSEAGTFAFDDGILISLYSDLIFENSKIEGELKGDIVQIDNISKLEHIEEHSMKLGIRYYEHNSKHGKKPYIRSGGVIASEMDLHPELAQEVLDKAIQIDGHLYGCHEKNYYEFRNTEKNTYHGYKNMELPKEIRRKIRQSFGEE